MCLSKITKKFKLKKSEARTAYKVCSVTSNGRLFSPIYRTRIDIKMSDNYKVLIDLPHLGKNAQYFSGFHMCRTRKGAERYLELIKPKSIKVQYYYTILEVKYWGNCTMGYQGKIKCVVADKIFTTKEAVKMSYSKKV